MPSSALCGAGSHTTAAMEILFTDADRLHVLETNLDRLESSGRSDDVAKSMHRSLLGMILTITENQTGFSSGKIDTDSPTAQ